MWKRVMELEEGRKRIRLLLADDHPLVLAGLRAVLEVCPRFDIVGEATDGTEAVRLACLLHPNVVLMDIRMPLMDGLAAADRLRQAAPDVRVLLISMYNTREYMRSILVSGARGFLAKSASADELVTAIETIHQGDEYFDFGRVIERSPGSHSSDDCLAVLSQRQFELLSLIANGERNKEIAGRLQLSVRTVEHHRHTLMKRLGFRSAADLVRFALQHLR